MPEMRAIVIVEPGGPEVLELREVERPEPGPGEVRVRVRSSGINRADLSQRRGRYPAPPGWPEEIPGLEFAGTVDAVGTGVRLREAGDRVMGLVGGGGCAEHVTLHERETIRVPDAIPLEEAGGIPEVFITAWDAVFRQLGVVSGETLLVHACGSGVGTAAIQLARVAGVRTVGTSRTPEKVTAAEDIGLDAGVVADPGWLEGVREATGGRGVDAILDLVGGPYLSENLRALAPEGRQIVVGVPGGATAEIDLRALMGKRATLVGTVLRARPPEEKMALARAFEDRIVGHLESGALRPVVDARYPPEEAAEAHRRMEANLNFGKLLIDW